MALPSAPEMKIDQSSLYPQIGGSVLSGVEQIESRALKPSPYPPVYNTCQGGRDHGDLRVDLCKICQKSLFSGVLSRVKNNKLLATQCGVGMHRDCAKLWLKAHPDTCPLSRKSLDGKPLTEDMSAIKSTIRKQTAQEKLAKKMQKAEQSRLLKEEKQAHSPKLAKKRYREAMHEVKVTEKREAWASRYLSEEEKYTVKTEEAVAQLLERAQSVRDRTASLEARKRNSEQSLSRVQATLSLTGSHC
jgi:hypothetical protein